ncbi:MAG: hypothetical protein JWM98_2912 [Thermoleophilia bacterium]|nr:hypothetical protein [Thermoleophilia bacterium]
MAPLTGTSTALPKTAPTGTTSTTAKADAKATTKHSSLFSTTNLVLGGVAATSIAAGGILGKLKGHGLIGLGIGAGVAAAAVGAALLGGASSSYRDGYCDSYGDIDCDYPGTTPSWDPNPGGWNNPGWNPGGYNDGYPTDGGWGGTPNSPGDE